MILNLRKGEGLPSDLLKLFGDIALQQRLIYNEIIHRLGEKNKNDYRWWFTDLASRNTFANSLYLHLCYLALIEQLLDRGDTIEIIKTDSYSLKKVLSSSPKIIKAKIKVEFKLSYASQLKSISFPFFKFVRHNILILTRYYKIRKTHNKDFQYPDKICLIDIFIINNSFNNSSFIDRYYNDFAQYFSPEERERFFYTPTFIKPNNFSSTLKDVRNADQNFILKEDFLTFSDVIRALVLPFRLLKFKTGDTAFLSFNIKPLIAQANFLNISTGSMREAFLKYQFAFRLKEKGVKISMVVDWFENQVIDKGFNMGFRKFFPEVKHKGYQVVLGHKLYLCFYPTTQELESSVLPNEIAVSGKGFKSTIKEFCPNLEVSIAPSFRYQHVWRERKLLPNKDQFTVLLALPSFKEEAMRILILTSQIIKLIDNSKMHFLIKLHPTYSIEKLKRDFKQAWPEQFHVVSGPLEDFIEKSDVVISNNSSLCLEVVAKGVPTVVVGNVSGITHIPLPDIIDDSIWKLCFNEEELYSSILFFLHQSPEQKQANKINGKRYRELFFEPVNSKTVRSFFHMD
jgi:hypothetical protein